MVVPANATNTSRGKGELLQEDLHLSSVVITIEVARQDQDIVWVRVVRVDFDHVVPDGFTHPLHICTSDVVTAISAVSAMVERAMRVCKENCSRGANDLQADKADVSITVWITRTWERYNSSRAFLRIAW